MLKMYQNFLKKEGYNIMCNKHRILGLSEGKMTH